MTATAPRNLKPKPYESAVKCRTCRGTGCRKYRPVMSGVPYGPWKSTHCNRCHGCGWRSQP